MGRIDYTSVLSSKKFHATRKQAWKLCKQTPPKRKKPTQKIQLLKVLGSFPSKLGSFASLGNELPEKKLLIDSKVWLWYKKDKH